MSERVDVCIVGSGFGGSISAWRLAELYQAAGADPSKIVVLERGARFKHTDFRQSMYVGNLARVYELIQSVDGGAQVVVANAVGGGSNLYLAASLRAPSETFERRDHNPDDGPDRRMWPGAISRGTLDPYYARAEAGLRVSRPRWDQVSKSGGLWAATLAAAGYSCDRVPLAIDPGRCVNAKWCHTGCIFGAKNTVNTNYLASAEHAGVDVRPSRQVELIRRSLPNADGYRYVVTVAEIDNDGDSPTRQPTGTFDEIECKVLIVAAGAMGTPLILLRSRATLPSLSGRVGKHLGVNGDHVAGVEYDPVRLKQLLGIDYGEFYKGRPITTMSYDFWKGPDGTRFNLQEIFLSTLTNFLYDDGRTGDPSWWGLDKKHSIATWNNHIELLAMVEDTSDGEFVVPPPDGDNIRPNAGPVTVGLFTYQLSDQSQRVRERANATMKSIVERDGLARLLKLSESNGAYCAHPLGGCRMAESKDLGVVDDRCEAFDNEGLFCIDSSAIPTSLGVNPSLTISAVSERAAEHLVNRAEDYGLPKAPPGFRPQTPGEYVGDRVIPVSS
jgi:enediyne biosynthesis protein E9